MKINTALILCAGFGKRLNPLTLDIPKPLLKINDHTLLENCINFIKKLGIKKIILNTFHKKKKIYDFLEKRNFDLDIQVIDDGEKILDTGGGIKKMMNYSNESTFYTFNTDTIWKEEFIDSIKKMENFYFLNDIKNILLVVNKSYSFDKNLKGDFDLIKNKLQKNSNSEFIYTGCQIISKDLLMNNENNIFPIAEIWDELKNTNELFGYEVKSDFIHVTNLEIYKKLLSN